MNQPWPQVALVDAADLNPRMPKFVGSGTVDFVPMSALDAETGRVAAVEARAVQDLTAGLTPFAPGDVLVAKITPCFQNGKIGQVHTTSPVAYGSTEFHIVRAKPNVADARYLHHYLRQPWVRVAGEKRMTGSGGQRRVPLAFFAELPLPLPQIEEQRRIAAILDAAGEVRAKRRESLAHAELLRTAFVARLRYRSKSQVRLGDVAEVQGGLQVSRRRLSNPLEVPYLRVANVFRGRMELAEVKTMMVTPAELQRTALIEGDLLFVEGHGNEREVGRVGRWAGEVPLAVHQNHLIRVRLHRNDLPSELVEALLNDQAGRVQLQRASRTTSGLHTISTSDVRSLTLPVPTPEDLAAFSALTSALGALNTLGAKFRAAADELMASLQQRAFRGEL